MEREEWGVESWGLWVITLGTRRRLWPNFMIKLEEMVRN